MSIAIIISLIKPLKGDILILLLKLTIRMAIKKATKIVPKKKIHC